MDVGLEDVEPLGRGKVGEVGYSVLGAMIQDAVYEGGKGKRAGYMLYAHGTYRVSSLLLCALRWMSMTFAHSSSERRSSEMRTTLDLPFVRSFMYFSTSFASSSSSDLYTSET